MLGHSVFRNETEHPHSFFLIVDPALQQGVRWGVFQGILEGLSYERSDTITVFPHQPSYREYKADLLSFLKQGTCAPEVLALLEGSNAAIVHISWEADKPKKDSGEEEDAHEAEGQQTVCGVVPRLNRPMEVKCFNVESLLDETKTGNPEVFSVLRQIYSRGYYDDKSAFDLSKKNKAEDIIMVKPNLFGFGVDLNALLRRIFQPPSSKLE